MQNVINQHIKGRGEQNSCKLSFASQHMLLRVETAGWNKQSSLIGKTACPVCHPTPSLTFIQAHSLLVRIRLPSGISIPAPLLPLLSLSFPASYWLPNCPYLLPIGCQILPPPVLQAYIYGLSLTAVHFALKREAVGPPKHQ